MDLCAVSPRVVTRGFVVIDMDSPAMRAGIQALLEPLGYIRSPRSIESHHVHLVDERRLGRPRTSRHVVAVLSMADGDLVSRAAAAGARGIVHCDDPVEDLARAIARVDAGGFWVSAAFSDGVHELLVEASSRTVSRDLPELSPRQREVLDKLVAGRSTATIADELGIAPGTVKLHVSDVLRKLGVASRAAAVAVAIGARNA